MSIVYAIEFDVRPGQRERFLGLLHHVLDRMRHEPSFVNATLHEDPADPDRFFLHETWQDHDEVVAVQLLRPYREAWHAALPDLLQRDRRITMWAPLRTDAA
jgi:quinol monooxygenase YgiN